VEVMTRSEERPEYFVTEKLVFGGPANFNPSTNFSSVNPFR